MTARSPTSASEVPPVADGADRTTAQVSYRKGGNPVPLSVLLTRTPAGWRIADVVSASGQSFQASMAACVAPVKWRRVLRLHRQTAGERK